MSIFSRDDIDRVDDREIKRDHWHNYFSDDSECKIERFFKDNPRSRTVLISCNCPKCRIHC